MLPIFAMMGIGRADDNFNYEQINKENPNRAYKVTRMDPMNSNIAFVMYNCESGSGMPKYTLRAFHNENLIKTDGCRSKDCPLDDFMNYFTFFTNTCGSTAKACAATRK